jgi:hypothetical protein
VNHSTAKTSTAAKRMRSANEPTMSATVMAANVAWKATKTYSGMVGSMPESVSGAMPLRNSLSNPP